MNVREHGEKLIKPMQRPLTEDDARAIRRSSKRSLALAQEYGVSYDRITNIRDGISFRAVAREVPLTTDRDPVRGTPRTLNLRGSAHGRARLCEADIPVIRASREKHKVLAERYGVTKMAISHVVCRRTWRHVP